MVLTRWFSLGELMFTFTVVIKFLSTIRAHVIDVV